MHYVDKIDFFDVEFMQNPCIKGEGAPTTSTEADVGFFYMNTLNGDVYKCISVDGNVYTWEPLAQSSGGNMDLTGYIKSIDGIIPDENGEVSLSGTYLTRELFMHQIRSYAKERWVTENYQPKGNYLTEVPDGYAKTEDIPTKPEDIGAQPAGNYLTEHQSLAGYATENYVKNQIAEAELSGGDVDLSGYATKDELPTKVSQLQNDSGYLTAVPDGYAKTSDIPTKPEDICAQPAGNYLTEHQSLEGYAKTTDIPTKVSQLTNDKGYLTEHQSLDGYAKTSDIPTKPSDIGAQPAGNYALKNEIPNVPVQSVNGKTGAVQLNASDVGALPSTYTPPNQTAEQVGADPAGTATSAVASHNVSTASHEDIRLLINGLTTRMNALANSSDEDLDQMAELVAYIKNNKSLIDSVTTNKVNVADIVNNLTTNVSNKPLSAAQGVALKVLIDAISVPTKVSELTNDKEYVTSYDFSEIVNSLADKSNVKFFGAVGDGAVDDTAAFQTALANVDVVNVTKGTYVLSDTITIRSGCKVVLDRDVHLKFIQTDKHAIVMQKFAVLDGGNGSVSVPEGFSNGVIVFDSELDGTNKTDVFPYQNWSPMQKYGRIVRNLDIVRVLSNGRLESSDGSCSGTAIYLHTSTKTNHDFLWACIIDHINISGAFSYGIRARSDGGWLHDTKIESTYIDSCEVGVSLENMHNTYVDCIIQPRKALNDVAYAKQGLKLVNSQHCMAIGLKVWDWQLAATGDEYKHIAMYGNCGDLVFADITYDNYSKVSDFWASTIYTDTPTNYDNITLVNEPNTKWFYNNDDVPYFRKESGTERLATFADLEANFGTSIVPNFEDKLCTAIDRDHTIYNTIGYKKGYRIDAATGNEVKMSDNTYTATGFIPVNNGNIIRFANLSMWINGYCVYVLYDENFNRVSHMSSEALVAEHNLEYFGTIVDESGNITQFTVRGSGVAYIRLTFGTKFIFANPMVSVNEEITYSTYGSLSPDIAVDYNSLLNVPKPIDLSIYQSKNIVDSGGYFGTDTVDGALQEIGGILYGLEEVLEGLL